MGMNETQRQQISELYLGFYDFLLSYALSSLKNDALAEEAVQETFAIASAKPDKICTSPNPRGWLVQTLKYVISNMERRRATAEKLVSDCLSERLETLPDPNTHEDLSLLYGDVAHTKEFKLMLEISQEGKSLIQIAEENDLSLNAVKKRAQRAREFLQKRINHESPN